MSDKYDKGDAYKMRPVEDLEPHYSRHVAAITREKLHSKSDIAAELACRDWKIQRLTVENTRINIEATEIGNKASQLRADNRALTAEGSELKRCRRALWDALVKAHTDAGCRLGEAQIFADIAEAPGASDSGSQDQPRTMCNTHGWWDVGPCPYCTGATGLHKEGCEIYDYVPRPCSCGAETPADSKQENG